MAQEHILIRDIIQDHSERMLNIKRWQVRRVRYGLHFDGSIALFY